jgi:hypothetical protein
MMLLKKTYIYICCNIQNKSLQTDVDRAGRHSVRRKIIIIHAELLSTWTKKCVGRLRKHFTELVTGV